jgi:hypothetical protein
MSTDKYIQITKDNVKEYLFTDVECGFSNNSFFSGVCCEKGKLTGVFTDEDEIEFQCCGYNEYNYCRTKNPNYKEPKDINEMSDRYIKINEETCYLYLGAECYFDVRLEKKGILTGLFIDAYGNVIYEIDHKKQYETVFVKNPNYKQPESKDLNEMIDGLKNMQGVDLYFNKRMRDILKEIVKRLPSK